MVGLAVVVMLWVNGVAFAADEAAAGAVNPWATGGTPSQPGDVDGKPGAVAPPPSGAFPVAQAYAVPTAVIQGGAIPPGWQPQAIPYQAIGPDGKPMTVHVAPTYVFTYVAGPPVTQAPVAQAPVARQVNRIQANGPPPGWAYQSRGATPVVTALPVMRSAPVPYQYPAGAPALAGQSVVPPPSPIAPPAPMVAQAPLPPPPAPVVPPAAETQWVSAPVAPSPSGAAAAPAMVAGTAAAAGAVAASEAAPPMASIPPPSGPATAPPMTPVSTASPAADPAPPQPAMESLSNTAPGRTSTHVWRVVGVHDGDTLTCLDETNTQQKVRLAEIDAPELGQDYGKVSREALAEMVFGKTVTVTEEGKDRYGRWIAHLQVNGADVNRQMVATGNAWHYADYSRDTTLATLQTDAQTRRLGLWSQPEPVAPWDFRQTVKKAAAG